MRDKSKRIEQLKLSREAAREAAAAWNRVQKSINASKPSANDRFRKT